MTPSGQRIVVACRDRSGTLATATATVPSVSGLPTITRWHYAPYALASSPSIAVVDDLPTVFALNHQHEVVGIFRGTETREPWDCRSAPSASSMGTRAAVACAGPHRALIYTVHGSDGWGSMKSVPGVSGPFGPLGRPAIATTQQGLAFGYASTRIRPHESGGALTIVNTSGDNETSQAFPNRRVVRSGVNIAAVG